MKSSKRWINLPNAKKGQLALTVWGGITLACCLINYIWYAYNAEIMKISVLDPPRSLPFLGFVTLAVYYAASFWAADYIATEKQRKYFALWWKLAIPALFCILPMFMIPQSGIFKWAGTIIRCFVVFYYLPYAGCSAFGDSSLLILAPLFSLASIIFICSRAKKALCRNTQKQPTTTEKEYSI